MYSSWSHYLAHRLSILSTILILCLSFVVGLPFAEAQVSKVYAGAAQQTPDPIIPCTSSGFSVDATLNYPLPASNLTRFHRIERANGTAHVGYVVTTDSVSNERWLITYDGRSMQQIARVRIQLAGSVDYQSTMIGGEIFNGSLYLVREVNAGMLGCAAPGPNPCMSLSKWNDRGDLLGETIVGSLPVQTIDDVRLSGPSTLLVLYSPGGNRQVMLFSVPGAAFISTSASLGVGASGEFAINADNGAQYISFYDASKTIKRLTTGSSTVTNTGNWGFTASNLLGAMMIIPPNYIVGYSTSVGGIKADENYRSPTTLADIGNVFPFILADASANSRSTWWDSTNQRIYSWRSTGQLLRFVAASGVIDQRFSCGGGCAVSTSNPTTDFVESNGRLYNAADTAPGIGTITRIKVCATGGPPA